MRNSPAQSGLLPSTITSLLSTSTPEEMLARGDWIAKSARSEASVKVVRLDFGERERDAKGAGGSRKRHRAVGIAGRGGLPAAMAADARATVTQGHLTCTKCTSSALSIPALRSLRAPPTPRSRHARAGRHLRSQPAQKRCRSRAPRILPLRGLVLADAEHAVMRAHHAFGATGQHAGNFADQLRWPAFPDASTAAPSTSG